MQALINNRRVEEGKIGRLHQREANLAKALADAELECRKCVEAKNSCWDEQTNLRKRAKLVGKRARLNVAVKAKTQEANDTSASLEAVEAIITKMKVEAQNIQLQLNDTKDEFHKISKQIDMLVVENSSIRLQAYFELLPAKSISMEVL